MNANSVLLIRGRWRKCVRPGRIAICLLALLLVDCSDYQDRARSPLKPMVSVVHTKTNAFDEPPKVLEGKRPAYPGLEADRREKGYVARSGVLEWLGVSPMADAMG